MAFSSQEGKGFFKDWLEFFAKPQGWRTFMDIGCGAGAYGKIIREVFGKEVAVDAVEIYAEYINRHGLNSIYNRVIVDDVMHAWPMFYPYELIIVGDILEHLEKEKAIKLIECLKSKCRFIWVALPMKVEGRLWSRGYNQSEGEYQENPFEKHLHEWTYAEIQQEFKPLWIVPYLMTGCFLVEGDIR